ncbi:integrator complex subunit 7 [Strongylocentrotus purpuratus]|uniref:Integrator complex subunit 7 n=1 Tax=Strongylocentrotus purpuratus TaxID=7668 RepID=A0A7M7T5L2_STRPU|nr:integrator complex subunit 7 [Strongylocentrotus purpuratus]
MSSATSRLSSFGTDVGYGEQEHDANSALLELDKGLHSSKVGEQCEAIVRFPRLFEKYPFPILINSAFLKLADVFRDGNNFLRQCVLRVSQQSVKHLDKILNVDEFVRRIFFVIHSNDPVARAITLRVLGSIAPIIAERKRVHHSIHAGLDSHDLIELEAAIFAASCFAAESKTFASGISNKLVQLIEGLATPIDVKMKLIPIFCHMHYDSELSGRVRHMCLRLLDSYPAESFLTVTLDTLTDLAAASHMHIPDQVDLLLGYLESDIRRSIKSICIAKLLTLAHKAPHAWSQANVDTLCLFCNADQEKRLIVGCLDILRILSSSPAFLTSDTDGSVRELCRSLLAHWEVCVTSRALQVLIRLMCRQGGLTEEKMKDGIEDVSVAMETVATQCLMEDGRSKSAVKSLKITLESIHSLCKACPSQTCNFMEMLAADLSLAPDAESSILMCHCLASLSEIKPKLLVQSRDILQDQFSLVLQKEESGTDRDQGGFLVALAVLVLIEEKTSKQTFIEDKAVFLAECRPWVAYRIARQATRVGCHKTASKIFKNLTTQVASEHFYYWLGSLEVLSQAEAYLMELKTEIDPSNAAKLSRALQEYESGLAALRAGATPNHPLKFQTEFTRLRADWLHACLVLMTNLASIRTCPPPAIAPAVAMTTGQDLLRCGHMATQMQKSSQRLQSLADSYADLYLSSFDADLVTLGSIKILQRHCLLLVYLIDALILNSSSYSGKHMIQQDLLGSSNADDHGNDLMAESSRVTNQILADLQTVLEETEGNPVSHQHTECIQRACLALLKMSFGFPRYFYQALQSTSIKLNLSPSPRASGEPVSIATNTHLALKVEGVIQHGSQPGLFRKVDQIVINVNTTSSSNNKTEEKQQETGPKEIECRITPHNDYFSRQVLLSFPSAGLHSINVETSIADEDGQLWRTGPKTSLAVKAYVDGMIQPPQQQQQPAQQAGHSRNIIAGRSTRLPSTSAGGSKMKEFSEDLL